MKNLFKIVSMTVVTLAMTLCIVGSTSTAIFADVKVISDPVPVENPDPLPNWTRISVAPSQAHYIDDAGYVSLRHAKCECGCGVYYTGTVDPATDNVPFESRRYDKGRTFADAVSMKMDTYGISRYEAAKRVYGVHGFLDEFYEIYGYVDPDMEKTIDEFLSTINVMDEYKNNALAAVASINEYENAAKDAAETRNKESADDCVEKTAQLMSETNKVLDDATEAGEKIANQIADFKKRHTEWDTTKIDAAYTDVEASIDEINGCIEKISASTTNIEEYAKQAAIPFTFWENIVNWFKNLFGIS